MSSKPEYAHYLITRFNLRHADWVKRNYVVGADSAEWMRDRWSLFERYCLPSVLSQSEAPDGWLILLDTSTAPEYREALAEISRTAPHVMPHYIPNTDAMIPHLREHLFPLLNGRKLVTTRLDNDDILHKDALADVMSAVRAEGEGFYCLTNGLCYQTGPSVVLTRYDYPASPFVSYAEAASTEAEIETIYRIRHDDTGIERHEIGAAPRWIQVVHSGNLSNSMRGTPIFDRGMLDGFEVPALVPPGFADTLRFRLGRIAKRIAVLLSLLIGR